MAIPPDLDVNILRQRIEALSSTVTDLLARIDALEHRVRTLEVVRRIDAVLDEKSGGA